MSKNLQKIKRNKEIKTSAALIYNPKAGAKRKILPNLAAAGVTLEDIKSLLKQYQIPADYFPTKASGHATELARQCVKKGYKLVIAAGGDGTISEVANGLIGSRVTLAVLPLGSFMNTAGMLSVPYDLEKAVLLIKINRTRKIDVGAITMLGGQRLKTPLYFLETASIGLEAQVLEYIPKLEQGDLKVLPKIIKSFFDYYARRFFLTIDKKFIQVRATQVNVSNGPYTGMSLHLAPKARLNDHRLTVSIFKMGKYEFLRHIFMLMNTPRTYSPKVIVYQGKKVSIDARVKRSVHADARVFGTTPVEYTIIPNALNIITGFPKYGLQSLIKRTSLDP